MEVDATIQHERAVYLISTQMPANCCSLFSLQASPLFAPVICLSVKVTKSIAAPETYAPKVIGKAKVQSCA